MENIQTYIGKDKFFSYYNKLTKELKKGEFYYAFAFQSEYQSKEVSSFLKNFHKQLAKNKIDDRAIFNKEVENIAIQTYSDNKNIKIKIKDINIPVGLVITKDRVIQLGWKQEPFIIEIKNKNLFKYYYDFFMENWNINQSIEFAKEALKKLQIDYSKEAFKQVNNLKDNREALKIAEDIEKIEDKWKYEHKGSKNFGQKIAGETIKLWSVPRTTAELLQFLVVATKSKKILEIGTSAGYSTLYLAMGASYTKGEVLTIENLEPKAKMALNNFKNAKMKNIQLLKGNALDILKQSTIKDLDFVFLDADKENYGKYFDIIIPRLKKGGIIIADNVFDYGHMMKDYLDKVLGTKLPGSQSDSRVKSYTLPLDNGVLITKKIKD